MKKALVILGIVLFSNLCPLNAAFILVYEDTTMGKSVIPGALNLLGLSATTAANQDDFNTQLTSGTSWDLVIFAEQHTSIFFRSYNPLTEYVTGGGKLIAYTFKSNSGLSYLMEASGVDTNGDEIIADSHPLFAELPASIKLRNPEWVTFSRSWNPTGQAAGYGNLGDGHAAVLGNGGRTLLYGPLTDTYEKIEEGERFVANGINFLLIPEPATISLLAISGLLLCRRKKA
jgi:hypothetical protein